mmetsp:Transcript_13509/g.22834  ORF Transcript_13509/g.22834 Transcript_13509/m.22834 type:complete len:529 (-) Transcript_13509:93-1679(-)
MISPKAPPLPKPKPDRPKPAKNKIPPYQKLLKNQYINREHRRQDKDDISVCKCVPDISIAGPKSDDDDEVSHNCGQQCINYQLLIECHPQHCPCGDRCQNQKFQKRENAPIGIKETPGRGWGLFAFADIKENTFVIEYVGEVVSGAESQTRSVKYSVEGESHFYMMNLHRGDIIDATRKAGMGRFINHSCEPNCVTRKVEVFGELRIGIFTAKDLPEGAELTYDYDMEWYGGDRVSCLCGTASCVGFLGARSRGFQEEEISRLFGNVTWDKGTDGSYYAVAEMDTYNSTDEEDSNEMDTGNGILESESVRHGVDELEKCELIVRAETNSNREMPQGSHNSLEGLDEALRPSDGTNGTQHSANTALCDTNGAQPSALITLCDTNGTQQSVMNALCDINGTHHSAINALCDTNVTQYSTVPLSQDSTPRTTRPLPQKRPLAHREKKARGNGNAVMPTESLKPRLTNGSGKRRPPMSAMCASQEDDTVLTLLDRYSPHWAELNCWRQKSDFDETFGRLTKVLVNDRGCSQR